VAICYYRKYIYKINTLAVPFGVRTVIFVMERRISAGATCLTCLFLLFFLTFIFPYSSVQLVTNSKKHARCMLRNSYSSNLYGCKPPRVLYLHIQLSNPLNISGDGAVDNACMTQLFELHIAIGNDIASASHIALVVEFSLVKQASRTSAYGRSDDCRA
jgi:hypothetical protein